MKIKYINIIKLYIVNNLYNRYYHGNILINLINNIFELIYDINISLIGI